MRYLPNSLQACHAIIGPRLPLDSQVLPVRLGLKVSRRFKYCSIVDALYGYIEYVGVYLGKPIFLACEFLICISVRRDFEWGSIRHYIEENTS